MITDEGTAEGTRQELERGFAGQLVAPYNTTTRRSAMPLINVKLIEDVFTPEQKGQIVERLTDAMVSIEGENMRGVTWVIVEEVHSGDWGIGGKPLSTEDVKALAAGVPA
jgi:4-oxalocrotonate tautomerase